MDKIFLVFSHFSTMPLHYKSNEIKLLSLESEYPSYRTDVLSKLGSFKKFPETIEMDELKCTVGYLKRNIDEVTM